MTGSKFHTVMVVGDNPEELMKKYDISLKVAPYIKFKYLDADKMRKNACKVMQELIKNRDKFGFNDLQADYFKEKLKSLNSMSSFEYYSSLTEGMYYDENGNALSEDNPNGKWTTYALGRNFSYPLKLKNGEESYQALCKDVDWDKMHMNTESVELFETIWQLAVDDEEPEDEQEEKIKNEWKNRTVYLNKFKNMDQFVAHNCAYWNYAFLDEKGWHDVDDDSNEIEWVSTFFDKYIENLKDDDKITIYEYSVAQ